MIYGRVLRARLAGAGAVWATALLLPVLLLAPAIWNGYPLLQWDTGGYLARWYEGYLVPSRSTVFGLYLHYGETSRFWLNLGIQALATFWILQLSLRVFGLFTPLRLLAIGLALVLITALPWLASMLLTDVFAGLSVLSLFILVVKGDKVSSLQKAALFAFIVFSAASHSATLGVLVGLCVVALAAKPLLPTRISVSGLMLGALALVTSAALLLSANHALSGRWAWTPGGSAVAFGRMMQDGIVARYLNEYCPSEAYKLCPYRNDLPATADEFLWGHSVFDKLGRFAGMDDEMSTIVARSLNAYPLVQAVAALKATGQQLVDIATGEGCTEWLGHTYGIMARYLPSQLGAMRAARQQHGELDFTAINRLHVPVAWLSMLAVLALFAMGVWHRRFDDLTLLAGTVGFTLLGNAMICGIISGPHDRYGARLVWIATFTVLIAITRALADDEHAAELQSHPDVAKRFSKQHRR